jgi:hypothetical protein
MPTYDYLCEQCGQLTEKVLSHADSYRKQWCRRLHLGTGSFCGGALTRQFPMPKAFLTLIESRTTTRKLKAEGKFCPGNANLREMEQHWAREEKENEALLDAKAKKWAEDCVTELGDSGLYTPEKQQRGDVLPSPVPAAANGVVLGNP